MGYYDAMKQRIKADGGVTTATLGELRDGIQQARLGPYVLENVAEKLRQEGIDFFPEHVIRDNPAPRQHQEVRLVALDPNGPIFRLMKAIQDPTQDGDDFLRALGAGSSAAGLARLESRLERVRGALEDAVAALDEPDDADDV